MNLLEEAERIYRVLGTLPIDMVAALIEAGHIIETLEEQWSKHEG